MQTESVIATFASMEDMISMSIATFVKRVALRYIAGDGPTIAVAAVVAVCVSRWAKGGIPTASGVYKVCLLLIVDKVMSSLSSAGDGMHERFIHWVASTALLAGITAVSSHFPQTKLLNLLNTYAYYSYAENGQFLTGDPDLNKVLPAVALLGCSAVSYSLHHMTETPRPVIKALLQGTGMIMSNVIVTLLLKTNDGSSDILEQLTWLMAVLVVVDNIHTSIGIADEIKSYTIWKSAQQIEAAMSANGTAVTVLSAIVAGLYSRGLQMVAGLNIGVVTHTIALGGINALLAAVRNSIAHTAHAITLVILVSVLSIVETVMHVLKSD